MPRRLSAYTLIIVPVRPVASAFCVVTSAVLSSESCRGSCGTHRLECNFLNIARCSPRLGSVVGSDMYYMTLCKTGYCRPPFSLFYFVVPGCGARPDCGSSNSVSDTHAITFLQSSRGLDPWYCSSRCPFVQIDLHLFYTIFLTTSVLQLESRWFSLPCDMLNVENGKASSGWRTRTSTSDIFYQGLDRIVRG